jgi:hypothetical protein
MQPAELAVREGALSGYVRCSDHRIIGMTPALVVGALARLDQGGAVADFPRESVFIGVAI